MNQLKVAIQNYLMSVKIEEKKPMLEKIARASSKIIFYETDEDVFDGPFVSEEFAKFAPREKYVLSRAVQTIYDDYMDYENEVNISRIIQFVDSPDQNFFYFRKILRQVHLDEMCENASPMYFGMGDDYQVEKYGDIFDFLDMFSVKQQKMILAYSELDWAFEFDDDDEEIAVQ